ncbi:MAG TPA: hypothetical protein PLE19_13660 [Planctomycetota bacterium]|nr:hypothetical protein [Planctomycetota bacterium]HRR81939.1 hypothetical protein [Planctomycetota bacterium]HRT96347.1 hypothetical protein [Planctomycetota bacterium]
MRSRLRRVVLCATLAGLSVLCASCSQDESPDAAKGRVASPKPGAPKAGGVEFADNFQRIRIEAEDAVQIESDDALPGVGGKVMRIVEDPEASGGKCIFIPDKAGVPDPDPSLGVPPKFARAVYKFKVAVAGNYTFWIRRKWYDSCGDTLFVRFDQVGRPHTEGFIVGGSDSKPVRWAWSSVVEGGQPHRFFLAAGEHTLEILNREDGPRFDVILLTDDPDYVPQGLEP